MIIGMAGGVGSGKSTVLSVLNQYEKVRICMADELGHQAMEQGTQAYQKIISHFGTSICSDGYAGKDDLVQQNVCPADRERFLLS